MERLYAYAVSAVLIALALYPLSWPRGRDSFPLSPYPMFSANRKSAVMTLEYAVGLEPGGERHFIAPELVANDEVLQARAVLSRAVASGPGAAMTLCEHIASRVGSDGAELKEVREIRIVRGTHDAVKYLAEDDRSGTERVFASCRVEKGE